MTSGNVDTTSDTSTMPVTRLGPAIPAATNVVEIRIFLWLPSDVAFVNCTRQRNNNETCKRGNRKEFEC
jgi:hypothetical protein